MRFRAAALSRLRFRSTGAVPICAVAPSTLLRSLRRSSATATIERLLDMGLLEIAEDNPRTRSKLRSHPSAAKSQDPATESHDDAVEGNGREHHHQEAKGTEKKGARNERHRTKRAREDPMFKPGNPATQAPLSKKIAGDDEGTGPDIAYASPDDELKAIYLAKAGEAIAIEVLDAIRANLANLGVATSDFVAEVKKHARNHWSNPAGFLRALSRDFLKRTRVSGAPVTAEEAAARDYRCAECGSRVPGHGAIMRDNKMVPCSCASAEYIAHQRERGVFAEETVR